MAYCQMCADKEVEIEALRAQLCRTREGIQKAIHLATFIEKSDDVLGHCGCRHVYDKKPNKVFPDDVCMSCKGMYINMALKATLDALKEGK